MSNHQPHDYSLKSLFRRRSKKTSNSAPLAFVWGIHRWPVNSPHKGPVTRKMFPFDDVILWYLVVVATICLKIDMSELLIEFVCLNHVNDFILTTLALFFLAMLHMIWYCNWYYRHEERRAIVYWFTCKCCLMNRWYTNAQYWKNSLDCCGGKPHYDLVIKYIVS